MYFNDKNEKSTNFKVKNRWAYIVTVILKDVAVKDQKWRKIAWNVYKLLLIYLGFEYQGISGDRGKGNNCVGNNKIEEKILFDWTPPLESI